MNSIFVSYSAKDIAHVNSIISSANNFLSKNTDLWIATEKKDKISRLRPGENWRDEIKRNIEKSKGAVLLISENFLEAEIVKDFELPLIIKKSKSDPDYKIYPVLVQQCKYEENQFLKSIQLTNSPKTSLTSLTGKRYQLEIENLINNINIDFPEKKSRIKLYSFAVSILLGFSLLFAIQNSNNNIPNLDQDISTYVNYKELGVSNCFNVEISDNSPFFFNGLTDNSDYELFINPYYRITEKVNCAFDHHGQILSKNKIFRNTSGTLTLPIPSLGFIPEEECFYSQKDIPGLVRTCEGVVVGEIIPGKKINKSSLKSGDVIKEINGFKVKDFAELSLAIRSLESDDYVILTYDRRQSIFPEVTDFYSDKTIFQLDETQIESDREVDIFYASRDYCSREAENFGFAFDERIDSEDWWQYLSLPILSSEEILNNEIFFHCAVFNINTSNIEGLVEQFEELQGLYLNTIFKILGGDEYEEYQYVIDNFIYWKTKSNFAELTTFSDKFKEESFLYEIKDFTDIEDGNCFDLYLDLVNSNEANNKLFPIYPDCNENGKVNAQFIGSYNFDLNTEKLIVNTQEFQNHIDYECRELVLNFANNPIVAKSLFVEYFNLDSETIETPYATQAFWNREQDVINVKCAFMSFDLIYDELEVPLGIYGFTKFNDLLSPEKSSKAEKNNELKAGFFHCPENIYIGDGYFVGNNFKPYRGDRTSAGVVIGEWLEGNSEIDRIQFITDSNGPVEIDYWGTGGYFPPVAGEEILEFNEKYIITPYPLVNGEEPIVYAQDPDMYSYGFDLDLREYPNLQKYKNGVLPILIDIHPEYSGDLDLQFRVGAANGDYSNITCKTNVVNNPKMNLVINTGKQGRTWSNLTFPPTRFTYDPVDAETVSFTRLNNIAFKGDTEELLLDFDIETGFDYFDDRMRPTNIRVEMLICSFPNEPNCIPKSTPEHSYDKFLDYSSSDITFQSEDNIVKYGNIPYELTWEKGVFKYRNITMDYFSCLDVEQKYKFETNITSIDFECMDSTLSKIAVLLKTISYDTNWIEGPPVENKQCNIQYRTSNLQNYESQLYPEGKSIIFNSYRGENCEWKFPNINPTDDFLFYVPQFDFSKITKMNLYEGIPFTYIYP
jgi:hypothetical protein